MKVPKSKMITKYKERLFEPVKGDPNSIKLRDGTIINLDPELTVDNVLLERALNEERERIKNELGDKVNERGMIHWTTIRDAIDKESH